MSFARARGLRDADEWGLVGRSVVDGEQRDLALEILGGSDKLRDNEAYQVRLALGDYETVVQWLEQKWQAGAGDLFRLGVLPQYDPLRNDPRFIGIVRDLGLPNGYDPVTKTVHWP